MRPPCTAMLVTMAAHCKFASQQRSTTIARLSIGLAIWALGWMVQEMMAWPPMTLLVGWGLVWLAYILAYLGGWMAIFAAAYLTASLLAAIVIMPLMLKFLSATEYRDLAPMGKDSFIAAAVNSVGASILFVLAWVLTIPLWLIPGFSLLVPLLLMGWLNRRTFAYVLRDTPTRSG